MLPNRSMTAIFLGVSNPSIITSKSVGTGGCGASGLSPDRGPGTARAGMGLDARRLSPGTGPVRSARATVMPTIWSPIPTTPGPGAVVHEVLRSVVHKPAVVGGSRTRSCLVLSEGGLPIAYRASERPIDGSRTANALDRSRVTLPIGYNGLASSWTVDDVLAVHDVRPQDVLAAPHDRHALMDLPVVEDQGLAPLRRHQQGGPALMERGRPPLEAVVQVDQEREVALLPVVAARKQPSVCGANRWPGS